ncbi:MAG TPA: M28 family peptidase, partial [Clostridia bacterium]|nr:M28 family peptidase [Clostridia bacterium]
MRNKNEKKQERELEKKALELEKKLLEKKLAEAEIEARRKNTDNVAENKQEDTSYADLNKQTEETSQYADEIITASLAYKEEYDEHSAIEAELFFAQKAESGPVKAEDVASAYDFIESATKKMNTHTARIAGGWGEKRGARIIREIAQDSLNAACRLEPFDSRMLRGRGSFVILGGFYALCLILYLISFAAKDIAGVIITLVVFLLFTVGTVIILSLLVGFPWFEKLYPKKISYNVVAELVPKSEVKQTLIVSCNYDSPLGNNFKIKAHIMPKVLLGAVLSAVIFIVFCILKMSIKPHTVAQIVVLTVLPFVLCTIAIVALSGYISLSKNKVKENNGMGVATALAAVKYLVHNGLIPDDCKIVFVALAAENAGHGGAEEFVCHHNNEKDFFVNPVAINFGELRDDKITVVTKDFLHAQSYDENLVNKCMEAIREQDGKVESYNGIVNSLYG